MNRLEALGDGELLAAAIREPEAFAVFYRRHVRVVLAYARRRTSSPELALDLTAEVFAAALEASGRYRPEHDSAAAWLYGIARNKLADSARRGRIEDAARQRLRMEPLELSDAGLEAVEEATGGESLAQLVDGLPASQRDAIQARVIEERDYEEIAVQLDCSASVVRKRVSRGLAALRARTEEGR